VPPTSIQNSQTGFCIRAFRSENPLFRSKLNLLQEMSRRRHHAELLVSGLP
jgi:hypothetical protein